MPELACTSVVRGARVLLAASWLVATSGWGAERPVRSLTEYRRENVVMQQWDTSCGAAALATLLTYHKRHPVTEREVAGGMLAQTEPLRVKHRGGFSLLDMKRYAATAGFDGDGYHDMSIDDLAARSPLIVPVRLRGYDHFVVVRAVTDANVLVSDPGFGNYEVERPAFLRIWPRIGFIVADGKKEQ